MGNHNSLSLKNEAVLDGHLVTHVEVGEDTLMLWPALLYHNLKHLKRLICFNVFLNLLEPFFQYRKILDHVKLFQTLTRLADWLGETILKGCLVRMSCLLSDTSSPGHTSVDK